MTRDCGTVHSLNDGLPGRLVGAAYAGIRESDGATYVVVSLATVLPQASGEDLSLTLEWDTALRLAALLQVLRTQAHLAAGGGDGAAPSLSTRSGVFAFSGGRARSPLEIRWHRGVPGVQAVELPDSIWELTLTDRAAEDLALGILQHVAANGMLPPVTGRRART